MPMAAGSTSRSKFRSTISAEREMREAEQRYMEALNTLGEKAVNARSEARQAYAAYKARAIAIKYDRDVLPLRKTISEQTELQYNAMQVDAFALIQAAKATRPRSQASRRSGFLARLHRSMRRRARRRKLGLGHGTLIVREHGNRMRERKTRCCLDEISCKARQWRLPALPR